MGWLHSFNTTKAHLHILQMWTTTISAAIQILAILFLLKDLNIPNVKNYCILIFLWYVSHALYPELKTSAGVSDLSVIFALSDHISGPANIKRITFSKFEAEN